MSSNNTQYAIPDAIAGLSVVIPVYNSQDSLRPLMQRLEPVLSQQTSNFEIILVNGGTTRFAAVPVRHEPRQMGLSNYTSRKLITHASNMMTGFSTVPLQMASILGFGFTLFGIGVFIYVIRRFLIQGGSVPGFPFLASVIAIFSGVQLFMLGIIGEYLARMHFRINEMIVQLSALDEELFGIKTARAVVTSSEDVNRTLDFCQKNQVVLLIARCPVDKLNTTQKMEQHGFLLMDTLLYLEHNLMQTSLPDAANTTHIRPFAQHDVAEVAHTAAEMFQNYASHYAADPRLDQKKCDEVYVSWAVRSCLDRTVADEVLVAKQDGQIVGFGVLNQPDPTTGDGRLYGVLPTVQGRGIYRALMVRSLEWCREQGCTRMLYSTQITNVATQKVCARLGFEMSHAYYTFHRWFDETPFQ